MIGGQNFKDITNQRFGHLIAMWPCGHSGKNRRVCWLCICDCGQFKPVIATLLARGEARSCGSLLRNTVSQRNRQSAKHGKAGSSEYKIWGGIKQRCYNPNHQQYARYGGRGIECCPRLATDFTVWQAENGNRPSRAHTFDRINNNLGYLCGVRSCCGQDESNCRWATKAEQTQNRSITKLTPEIVREIRERHSAGETYAAIASTYEISGGGAWAAGTALTWANIV